MIPHFLREADHPWLLALVEAYDRFVGHRRRELDEHLRIPLRVPCPRHKLAIASRVLDRLFPHEPPGPLAPREARDAVFEAAAFGGGRREVLSRLADRLGTTPAELDEALFADLPGERRLAPPPEALDPGELALRANLDIAQSLLRRSSCVTIDLTGHARAIIRQAKWVGLIVTVRSGERGFQARIEVSGPLALFRRTLVYGRALAGLVPQLVWCDAFRLAAELRLDDRPLQLQLRSGDPIFPAKAPRKFDSRVEARFFRDFGRAAPDWDLVREPAPVVAGKTLIFPDFAIRHRRRPGRCWLLEILGYWTPEYVASKLRHLRTAKRRDLILCVDEDRQCSERDLPLDTPIIRYRRRVDPRDVLRIIAPGDAAGSKGSGSARR